MAVRAADQDVTPRSAWPDEGAADSSAAAGWTDSYERYLTRAAEQSARGLGLWREVIACIGRGELAPAVLEDELAAFLQARGAAYTERLADVSKRFLSEIVQVACRSILDRVAGGELEPAQVLEAASADPEQRLPEHLDRVAHLFFDLLTAVDDIRSSHGEELLEGVLARAAPPDEPVPGLDLVAPLGGTATGRLVVANTDEGPAVVRPTMGDVRRADGIGPAFVPAATVAPEELELAPGEEGRVSLTVPLTETAYAPGPLYVGSLRVAGGEETLVEVPVQIRATPA